MAKGGRIRSSRIFMLYTSSWSSIRQESGRSRISFVHRGRAASQYKLSPPLWDRHSGWRYTPPMKQPDCRDACTSNRYRLPELGYSMAIQTVDRQRIASLDRHLAWHRRRLMAFETVC